MIYLDHNATTPLAPSVTEAIQGALADGWGNPSSSHASGRRAKELLEAARRQVAGLIAADPADVTFTSGATEADNLAVSSIAGGLGPGTERDTFVCARLEHPAIVEACRTLEAAGWTARWVAPEPDGKVSVPALAEAIDERTALVALMLANNETGVIQPVAEAAELAHRVGARLVCDAVQGTGKIPVSVGDLGADYVVVTAHKMYGPKGAGALWSKPGAPVIAQQRGGSQERGRRGGTENVLGAVGLGAAAELAAVEQAEVATRVVGLRDEFERRAAEAIPDARVNGAAAVRLPNTSNILFPGVEGDGVALALDLEGICVSAGSACHSGAAHPSPVLESMGLDPADALASIRVSFGRSSNPGHLAALLDHLPRVVARLRDAAQTASRS